MKRHLISTHSRANTTKPAEACPPYVARVLGIELRPRCEWPAIDAANHRMDPYEYLENSIEADRKWVEVQKRKGWVPARYFKLKVEFLEGGGRLGGCFGGWVDESVNRPNRI
jgi:hypothetical protein